MTVAFTWVHVAGLVVAAIVVINILVVVLVARANPLDDS
jgi:hypothetical protein